MNKLANKGEMAGAGLMTLVSLDAMLAESVREVNDDALVLD